MACALDMMCLRVRFLLLEVTTLRGLHGSKSPGILAEHLGSKLRLVSKEEFMVVRSHLWAA